MRGGVCRSKARLDGKVVIVTGANTGIGKETAKDLVQRGAKVYIGCRSRNRALQAIKDIQKETGATDDNILLIILDLGSLRSVREFVIEFVARETKLDILINNAGVIWPPERKTEDGFDFTLGVNHLGHFLLTHLLMGALSSADKSRIINVTSTSHSTGKLDFDDLMYESCTYSSYAAYANSKLANILFTRELATRLKGTGITTYAVHPGGVQTEAMRNAPFFLSNTFIKPLVLLICWPFMKNCRDGAQTTIYCAVDEKLSTESGHYYSDCKRTLPVPAAQDDVTAKKLWDVSINLSAQSIGNPSKVEVTMAERNAQVNCSLH